MTVTGGKAPNEENYGARGSGIRITDSPGVKIENNLIEGNDDGLNPESCDCSAVGGGLEVSGPGSATITIRNNVIRDNTSHRGGAMAVFVNGTIEGNLVEDNHGTSDHGGGIYIGSTKVTVKRNLIRGNTIGDVVGYGWGGGAIAFGNPGQKTPKHRFTGNRWVGNSAPSVGSGSVHRRARDRQGHR